MRSRLFKPCLPALMIAALACASLLSGRVSAQEGGAKLWYKTANVTYKPKPDRKPLDRPRKRVEPKSLLTLQWRLFEREKGNVRNEVDPKTVFGAADQVKLAVTANQAGYLYIINQEEGKDGVLLFPDPNVNGGTNYVEKNKEYFIPDKCDDQPDAKDCWMEWTPEPDTENLIVIFSRDEITTLPKTVSKAHDVINRADIEKIVANSSKKVKPFFGSGRLAIPGAKAARYPTWVQNTDTTDNEDLVTTIKIKHGE
ncbi:MAG TPA: DUF4384 domain-containing protein [Blastocatellia bacterium]